jgi:cob(I)alamin adenosyltransferase
VTRIYTKTGDSGTTGLIGGKRVPKNAPQIEANGSLDELNALIGIVRAQTLPARVDAVLQVVQDDLFTIGSQIATPEEKNRQAPGIGDREISRLEREIDTIENDLEPLKRFILPGGSMPGAGLHWVRAVTRRAERSCVTLSQTENVDPSILRYLNRLSDLCFVLARYVNKQQGIPERHPSFGKA